MEAAQKTEVNIILIIAVVDDEKIQREKLTGLLREWAMRQGRPLDCDTYEDGRPFLQSGKRYEAVFLDIYMKELDGIETASRLRKWDNNCKIIYLTVSEDHRADAFRVHAFDYLEKPVTAEQVNRVMDDMLKSMPALNNRITLPVGKARIPVDLSALRQITSDANYCRFFSGDECSRVRISFTEIEHLLAHDRRFLKVNRGVLVNMDYVQEIENRCCRMKNGETLPVNMRKAASLRQELIHYQFEIRNRILAGEAPGTVWNITRPESDKQGD